jgi:hypothetical protein
MIDADVVHDIKIYGKIGSRNLFVFFVYSKKLLITFS